MSKALPDHFVDHCMELLAPMGSVRVRRMFGGRGFYVDDVFIALLAGEQLYLKTDAVSRPRFEAAGCEAFSYATHEGHRVSLSYWSAPEDAMESPALMQPWARLALEAALRARAPARTARKVAKRAAKKATKPASKRRTSRPA
ncbi:MAG: TfoX/Sxy family protein [Burkholderiales bacterium]